MFRRDQDWFSGEWLAQQLSWSAALAVLNIMQFRLLLSES